MWGALLTLSIGFGMTACSDDDDAHVEVPTFDITTAAQTAYYGDSIAFSVHAGTSQTALSVLTVEVVYGEEVMEKTTLRTKESDADYAGKLPLPYFANIADGQVKLRYTLLNVDFGSSTQQQEVTVTRPEFAYVTLHGEDDSYQLVQTGDYTYAYTGELPLKINGYIETAAIPGSDKKLTFGLDADGHVTEGSVKPIGFSSSLAGQYTVSFNTKNYTYSPKTVLQANGQDLSSTGNEYYTVDLSLRQGEAITFKGLADISGWWIDPDFFTLESGNSLSFKAIQGQYRLLIDAQGQYITARVLTDGELATLQDDGIGAVWIIGEGVGKPNVADYQVGWNTDNALALAPIGGKKYQITLEAGAQISINPSKLNFKFFYQAGWGGEFSSTSLTTDSEVIFVGDGENGRDSGNLGFVSEKIIPKGTKYILTLDLSAGNDAAKLSVETIESTDPGEDTKRQVNGTDLKLVDDGVYQADLTLSDQQNMTFTGLSDLNDWWIDSDFFTLQSATSVNLASMAGQYRLIINEKSKYMTARVLADGALATLQDDGTGALWIIGAGVGKPNCTDYEVGWNTDNALCLAPIGNAKYQLTITVGQQVALDAMNFKFFHQAGWGGEFSNATLTTDSPVIFVGDGENGRDAGNLGFVTDAAVQDGDVFRLTVDVSGGTDAATLTVEAVK